MNIYEVRLQLVQQLIGEGFKNPEEIEAISESLVRYIFNNESHKKKQTYDDFIGLMSSQAQVFKQDGCEKLSKMIELAIELIKQELSPPKKP